MLIVFFNYIYTMYECKYIVLISGLIDISRKPVFTRYNQGTIGDTIHYISE